MDVLESSDWYNFGYIIIWGLNVLLMRMFDVYFLVEVCYKGVKVILVSLDFVEFFKFVDDWLSIC